MNSPNGVESDCGGGPREQVDPFDHPQRRHRSLVRFAVESLQEFAVGERRRQGRRGQVEPATSGLGLEPVELGDQCGASSADTA